MGKKSIYLNNIPISNAFIVQETENVIICKNFKEEFFGIYNIDLENNKILCEHIEDDLVSCNVRIDDKEYKNIPFRLIVSDKKKSKVAINENTLTNPQFFVEKKEEEIFTVVENDRDLIKEEIILEVKNELDNKQIIIDQLNEELERIRVQNESQIRAKTLEVSKQVDEFVEEKVEDYKQKLLEYVISLNEDQDKERDKILESAIKELEVKIEDLSKNLSEEGKQVLDTQIEEIRKEFEHIANNIKESNVVKYEEIVESVREQLHFDYGIEIEKVKEELTESYKQLLGNNNSDFKNTLDNHVLILNKRINEKFDEIVKIDSDDLIAEAVQKLIENKDQKAKAKLEKFKKELLKELTSTTESHIKTAMSRIQRYAEMSSGGGGAFAINYQKGGTMEGDLIVTGSLSANYIQAVSASFTYFDIKGFELSGFNATGNLTVSGDVTSTGVFYTTGGNSNDWNNVYTNVRQNSALYATRTYTHDNFLPLSGGTITGNLSVLGDITYIDTQVSVVSTMFIDTDSSETALRITQRGSGDVIRVEDSGHPDTSPFIVKSNGLVGIGTVEPNASLTVVGDISATQDITTDKHITAHTLQASIKNFCIPHPTKAGKKLVYSSLESPYIGIQLTGEDTVKNGKCTVHLPDYINKLIHLDNIHIQLTSYGHSKLLYVDSIEIKNNCFIVKADGISNFWKEYKFFWSLTGIRKDVPELVTEI